MSNVIWKTMLFLKNRESIQYINSRVCKMRMIKTLKRFQHAQLMLHDRKIQIVILSIIIFCFSFFVRVVYLDNIPANLNPDEADTIQTYMRTIYRPHESLQLFSFNWNGAPLVNALVIGLSWDIFGQTIYGARLPSAFFTTCGIVVVFVTLILALRNVLIATLFSIALAVNPWLLSFSRSVWENAWNLLFLALILFGYELVSRKRQIGLICCLIGAVAGFYAYYPGKLFIFSFISVLIIYVLKFKEKITKKILIVLFVLFCYFIFVLPQAVSMMKNPIISFGRINTVSITQEENKKDYFIKSLKNNINGLLLFSSSSSFIGINSRYIPLERPFISRVLLPFFIIGIIYCLIKKKFYAWTFFLLLFPIQLLSRGTPDASRGVHMVGMYYMIISIGAAWVIDKINLLAKHVKMAHRQYINTMLLVVVVCGMWYVMLQDINTYTTWITSKQALDAREPAVWRYEYKAWRDMLKASIKLGKGGFNVYDWMKMTGRD